MHRNFVAQSLALALTASSLSGCSGFSFSRDTKYGVTQVDDLLTRVERVQVEAVLSKEKSRAALDSLQGLVAPDFAGDAVKAYSALVASIEASQQQAKALANCVEPMKLSANAMFMEWTTNLEEFGNTRMRQHSQARLEETRARFDVLLSAIVSAELSYKSFNADLHDHALYLEHDFNAAAVSTIAAEVNSLALRSRELDSRLDACVAAAKEYVESSALRGQLVPDESAPVEPAPLPATAEPRRSKSKLLKPSATATPTTTEPTATPEASVVPPTEDADIETPPVDDTAPVNPPSGTSATPVGTSTTAAGKP